tara:strand:+ start:316 stop:792 length:477 start_codon:yes stop_codon:yes gene_type:complete
LIHLCGLGIVEPLAEKCQNCSIKYKDMEINELVDLNNFKTAPILELNQAQKLLKELDLKIMNSDWLTIGVMAKSDIEAKIALRTITQKYPFICLKDFEDLQSLGNVFLKGNQKTGEVYIRSEYGLGEGILLTCQYDDPSKNSMTYGPFPLSFFMDKDY